MPRRQRLDPQTPPQPRATRAPRRGTQRGQRPKVVDRLNLRCRVALDGQRQVLAGDAAPLSRTSSNSTPPSAGDVNSRAPASIEFSINSLTAAAGRSMTSPAAILPIVSVSRWMLTVSALNRRSNEPPRRFHAARDADARQLLDA